MTFQRLALGIVFFAVAGFLCAQPVSPFETQRLGPMTPIDRIVFDGLRQRGISPAMPCSDAVFVRRVYLDMIGTLPTPEEARAFLGDRRDNKRALLIDSLFSRTEFADYWAMKWCDILRVKSEYPINLWPNAVQAYHRWIRDAVARNMPYDRFAREMLTSSGSNFRVPPVNFYRAIQGRSPSAIAGAVALTFMGSRFERWPAGQRKGFEAFFTRVGYKATQEWKEEIVYLNPASSQTLQATFPDGKAVTIPVGEDPRFVVADWLIQPDNPWFAKAIVNRVWSWFMGRGIIHEADDIRPDNPAMYPELLDYLAKELVASHYDLRHIYRLILNSNVYQQSSIPRSNDPSAEMLFAYYPTRRLQAEVIFDAINWIGAENRDEYVSPIPEPYSYFPSRMKAVQIADASVSNAFLDLFGRSPRDTGLESERNTQISDAQRLKLINSSQVQSKIEQSPRLRHILQNARINQNRGAVLDEIYLLILSRYPTDQERAVAGQYFTKPGSNPRQGAADLAWALINSKEFLNRH
ncbi:DUF1549 and DUF1553 domain-containing protein [bacterium]|nr:DUF1549 and DUF1553 domain-containing protein [bacterium]